MIRAVGMRLERSDPHVHTPGRHSGTVLSAPLE